MSITTMAPELYLETCMQDVRYAFRGFRKNPAFTVTIILTLMLGIGATTAVFSVVDRILFRPLPYANADRLVSLGLVQSLETQEFMLGYFYYDWQRDHGPFTSMTSEDATTGECDLSQSNPVQLSCTSIEGNFLPTLGVSPALGRNFSPQELLPTGPKVVLISYALWRDRYGLDRTLLNRTINIDGAPIRVIGVLPQDFEMPRLQAADLLFPRTIGEAADRASNGGLGGPRRVVARLKPGVSIQQARVELQPLLKQAQQKIPSEMRNDFHLKVRSLRDRQMQDVQHTAWLLFGAVLAVLLIACANVASLLLARGASRERELAVRSVLGATRPRLARQAIIESLLLSLAGALAGGALAQALLRLFIALAPANIPYRDQIHLDLRIACFAILLALFCGVFFGLAPALQRPTDLAARSRTGASHAILRQSLVVTQMAATLVLLAGATLLLRSFSNLANQDLGMRTDNTLTASIFLGEHTYPTGASRLAFFEHLVTRLRFGPGVSLVSLSDSLPPVAGHFATRLNDFVIAGRPPDQTRLDGVVATRLVSPDYFRALNIPMLLGEGFREEDMSASERPIVLSKRLAALLFPQQNPIGQHLRGDGYNSTPGPWSVVTGVANDVKNGGLARDDVPEMYELRRNLPQDWDAGGMWGKTSVLVVRSALPVEQTSRLIRSQVAAIDPALPVDLATLRQRVGKLADQPRFETLLVGFFAAAGLLLALIGVYGLISFLVAQRFQEIGVRMALGASRGSILRLVLLKCMRLTALGTALGLGAALLCAQTLKSLLFGISAYDPLTFTVATLLLVCVALIGSLIPASYAACIDPLVALRYDG